ncbi:Zinc finger protein 395 [Dissostichus eleginoides]|uniref:Zinc finger protein 395 n=1 Tax=Dissostichus eleginoides TaxID=100907 RepID=A0AAD9BRK1_DISEL|nr:Zinc finger protein 395 [Dissostichus eleginoides]
MAATGPEDRAEEGPGGAAVCPPGLQACTSTTTHSSNEPDMQNTLVCTPRCQAEKGLTESGHQKNRTSVQLQRELSEAGATWLPPLTLSTAREAPYCFRSPESVEMDEIMAAMVLTSLSCSPAVQSLPQSDPGPAASTSADMECGGGELSDSGSSGYWSWDHGNVSPAPSPSVTEIDSSPDEGLQMELEQGEELNAKKPKSSFRSVYRCLWPSCGKVLTSSVGIKRHIRVLHLGEEDFYYTKFSCESVDSPPTPAPSQQALGQASPSPLSQSAPSSFWQIHSEHLYQACSPVQVSVASRTPGCQGWNPSASVSGHSNTPVVKPRCRSVSVGEQWLQQNRLQPMTASPSRTHCSFRKGRGEAKKCRKVYGVERKDQWCTACRWKKACQRFPD